MDVLQVINILAIILSPIIAVIVGQKMQDWKSQRCERYEIYKYLLNNTFKADKSQDDEAIITDKYDELVSVMNLIPTVFYNKPKVINAYREMKTVHVDGLERAGVDKLLRRDMEKIAGSHAILLMAIAKCLGYPVEIETFDYTIKRSDRLN